MNLSPINDYFLPSSILDIGANVGQFRTQAQEFWPDSYIFSIEASDACEEHLNKLTNDYLICLLAKDESNYKYFSRKNDPTSTGNSIYRELTRFFSDDQLEVIKKDGITLDSLFAPDRTFDLIKMDTQGSELDIIEGGREICSRAKAILLEVSYTEYNKNAPLVVEVVEYMQNFNFEPSWVLDESRNHGAHQQDILFINKAI